ncbi:MAG: TlpA disulfide reductase family protein [Comamonadaceae bacterium]|nr:TlpA disulfide reductase family protein [Comamonadaceae bacterium]
MPAPDQRLSRRAMVRLMAAAPAATFAAAALTGCAKDAAPDTRLLLLDGRTLDTASLRGQVYLVNFWATSCTTCVAEMPEIVATYQRYKNRGYDTVAVAMQYDPPAYVTRFAQTRALPFKVAVDHDGQAARAWGDVQLTPTTYLVDRQGRIVKRYVGRPDFTAMHALIERLLAEG